MHGDGPSVVTAAIFRYSDPARWRNAFTRAIDIRRERRLDRLLDAKWEGIGPVSVTVGQPVVVADGMWYNANHFLRLRLFIQARAAIGPCRLLGVLRNRRDKRARRALARIGFQEFVYLEDDIDFSTADFLADAERLLSNVRTHRDFLTLVLPEELPAYIVYDTVLKLARDPQPALTNPLWRQCLAEALRDIAIYQRELTNRRVTDVALSHPWKTEWGSLIWLALKRKVTAYHLTGFMEAMRIRRFQNPADFAIPVEHLSVSEFTALPAKVQHELATIGAIELENRATGGSTDINANRAFVPGTGITERPKARQAIAENDSRPVAVIYAHVWYDFPHTFAMSHFTDFRHWMHDTIERIKSIDDVLWLLRPHPTEDWYGGFQLVDLANDLPEHVRLLPPKIDSRTVLSGADCIVTVHGTVGLEATAWGVPVILADQSYYSGWNIGHPAASRSDYLRLLGEVSRLAPPDAKEKDRARAAFALALAQPPGDTNALRIGCDSRGALAIEEVIDLLHADGHRLTAECERLVRFMSQDRLDSFAAFHLVETARKRIRASPQARVSAGVGVNVTPHEARRLPRSQNGTFS